MPLPERLSRPIVPSSFSSVPPPSPLPFTMTQRRPEALHPSSREKQPRTFTLTLKALLSLPYRLCNPPPAVGKVRSCQVTPIFKVRLEDVLNRKHLPPLGLKDFEEWLLFVEGCPENLYFILWLKDYAARYNQWVAQSKPVKVDGQPQEHYRFSSPTQPSSTLSLLYLRAKQTFFTPNAEYELNIPSDILSPFHTGHFVSPHPDPIVFSEVAWEAHKMLKESLDRFVLAAYNNVGTNRVRCGMAGGIVISLLGSVAPLAVNFSTGRSRWLRLLAIPGLALGLTILIASLHGVCMMVYIFGDLRQLRKFELARPRISAPQPLDSTVVHARPSMSISSPLSPFNTPASSSAPSPILPFAYDRSFSPFKKHSLTLIPPPRRPTITIPAPPPPVATTPTRGKRYSSPVTTTTLSTPYDDNVSQDSRSSSSLSNTSYDDPAQHEIIVSPAYYDEDPAPEGPATLTGPFPPFNLKNAHNPPFGGSYRFGGADREHTAECRFNRAYGVAATASFIRPFNDDDYNLSTLKEENASIDSFDFDALPSRRDVDAPCICGSSSAPDGAASAVASSAALPVDGSDQEKSPGALEEALPVGCTDLSPTAMLARAQYKCNRPSPATFTPVSPVEHERIIQAQEKRSRSVSAFGPLTKVLNPVVTRAQWEIVMRSAFLAFVISVSVVGCLCALPVPVR